MNTTASVGSQAFIPCILSGISRSVIPSWFINGRSLTVTTLPNKHRYNGSGIIIRDVDLIMNMNSYSCVFDLVSGYFESTIGHLTVLTHEEQLLGYKDHFTSITVTTTRTTKMMSTSISELHQQLSSIHFIIYSTTGTPTKGIIIYTCYSCNNAILHNVLRCSLQRRLKVTMYTCGTQSLHQILLIILSVKKS